LIVLTGISCSCLATRAVPRYRTKVHATVDGIEKIRRTGEAREPNANH
jgi:hypothetical protein